MGETLRGIPVSAGVVVGPVARMGAAVGALPADVIAGDAAEEWGRAEKALGEVAAELEARRDRASGPARDVLDAQSLMAADPTLLDAVHARVDSGESAAAAVDAAIGVFREQLEAIGGYLGERAADLGDVRDRAVARLLGLPLPGIPQRDEPYVLIAHHLAPADTVDLDPAVVVGLVTEGDGPTSHTAIIAKALGLPAVVACPGILALADDTPVLVDGTTGTVVVTPSKDEADAALRARAEHEARLAAASGPGRTADGHPVQLLLNAGAAQDIAGVDAEGIGLLRTEFLFLGRDDEPSVEEQVATYRQVFDGFAGRKVIVRTLDVGADKPLPFVEPGPGENPALGLRGDRLRLLNPDLLTRQLTALATAAQDSPADVHVMAPMIATVAEARTFVDSAHAAGLAKAGVMVEVPSLALDAERLMAVVDFASIGTNDLSQYTFAADRLVGELGPLLDPWQPAVLRLVAMVARAGQAGGTPVGVCGEAAADPALALVLVGLGITSLSMAAPALPEVRTTLAATSLAACRERAEAALAAPDARSARG